MIIPDRFLAETGKRDPFSTAILGREVALLGAGDRIELWNRAQLEAHLYELSQDRGSLQNAMQNMFTAPPPAPPATASGPG